MYRLNGTHFFYVCPRCGGDVNGCPDPACSREGVGHHCNGWGLPVYPETCDEDVPLEGLATHTCKVATHTERDGTVSWAIWCPACQTGHYFTEEWQFDGNLMEPTFKPSLYLERPEGGICHSMVREGRIFFCGDSTHEMAGQEVELPEFPNERPRIVFGGRERIEELDSWAREVLEAIGPRPGWGHQCFVSDETSIGDFDGLDRDDPNPEEAFRVRLERASARLGIELHPNDLLIDAANRLMLKVE